MSFGKDRWTPRYPKEKPAPDNYWTPGRVEYWLGIYPKLAVSCLYDCLIDAPDSSPPPGPSTIGAHNLNVRWANWAIIKADIDNAISRLPQHQRAVILLYYCAGQDDVRSVAKLLRIGKDTVWRRLNQANARLVELLCAK